MNDKPAARIETIESLRHAATALQNQINGFDSQIAALQQERAIHAKQLRSITTKIVTLQIKASK